MEHAASLAAGATVAPVLATLTEAWQASMPVASVSQEMIDDWEDAASAHAARARVEPPETVLAALAVDYTAMAPHLKHRQPEAIRQDLTHAAARHAALIGGKWLDLGNRREAQRWWLATRTLADESGDTLLASWLRSREALYRRGDPQEHPAEVLTVAQEARRLAGNAPSAPLVAALTAEAQALAMMGRHGEAVATLCRAEDIFERLPAITGFYRGWGERGLWYDQSLIYTLAGDVKRATEAQDAAEKLYPPADITSTAIRLHRAAVHTRTDPTEGTRQALRIVTGLPPERRTVRLDTDIVLNAVPEHARTLPPAQELRALTTGTR